MSSLNSQSDNTVDEHIIDEAKQSGISEKEAKNIIEEEEGIELLQHSGNLYESTDDKYKDNLSSAITFFVCGAAGIIILILNDIGILKFVTKGSSNFILVNVVLGLLFVGKIENIVDEDILDNPYLLYETEYDDYIDEKYNAPENCG